jgi:CxxC motif-containing protein (DUF1111 family)
VSQPAGHRARRGTTALIAALAMSAFGLGDQYSGQEASFGRRAFSDARNPPAYAAADAARQARIDLGHAVFNTQWLAAGAANAARRDGLGPLFNASACDACHNEAAHGRGPTGDGLAPAALVIQLEIRRGQQSTGDPRYGRTFNTAAIDGFAPEGRVSIRYRESSGRYRDGASYQLRVPRYDLAQLTRGPLAPRTIVQPRLAPALFGVGLLEAVRDAPVGRFGWQGTSATVGEQTSKAFARDMGLTTGDRPADDCTAAERECLSAANGGVPEVAPELLDAVVEFQRTLAVPEPVAKAAPPDSAVQGATLFRELGCAACHRPTLTMDLQSEADSTRQETIAPYTDLARHDLGSPLADRDVAGHTVVSRWRTAPLWGMAYRLQNEHQPTFLHDGRARSIEEAILWHDGEAEAARRAFTQLTAERRALLLDWVAML